MKQREATVGRKWGREEKVGDDAVVVCMWFEMSVLFLLVGWRGLQFCCDACVQGCNRGGKGEGDRVEGERSRGRL